MPRPEPAKKRCSRCKRKFLTDDNDRFCGPCKRRVITDMRNSGYLTRDPRPRRSE